MTQRKPKPHARLTIDIWTDGTRYPLPENLPEALHHHIEHVADLCGQGCLAGEIFEEAEKDSGTVGFSGWWKIEEIYEQGK